MPPGKICGERINAMLFFMVADASALPSPVRSVKVEESLISRIGLEDRQALAELYEETYRALYSYVLSLVKDPELTQDIVQETYLKIRAAAHLYQPHGKPMAWIFTIAKNLSRNALRTSGRTMDIGEAGVENDLRFSYVTDPSDRIVLKAALGILGEGERSILLLHAVSGLKHAEIAKSLGIPLSTALSRYHRAVKKLRKYLEEQEVSL